MFTKENSINGILATPGVKDYLEIFFSQILLECVPEELRSEKISVMETQVMMPWGVPFISEMFLTAAEKSWEIAQEKKYRFVSLWNDQEDCAPTIFNNKDSVFLLAENRAELSRKPAVIICPGGGYEMLSPVAEGLDLAEKMKSAGYVPFVLFYRVKPNYYPAPQTDLALAVKYVRANAEALGIDAESVMLIGASAGGHLCASFTENIPEVEAALLAELKADRPELYEKYKDVPLAPNQLCLDYSVISFVQDQHEDSFQALSGGNEALREKLSAEKHVAADFPKTFLWACSDDDLVPVNNTLLMAKALEEKGIPHQLRIYPTGGHGCGIAKGTSAAGWMDEMIAFMAQK